MWTRLSGGGAVAGEAGTDLEEVVVVAGEAVRNANVEECLADWPDHAHRLDVPVHEWVSRERMYAGHEHAHEWREAAGWVRR